MKTTVFNPLDSTLQPRFPRIAAHCSSENRFGRNFMPAGGRLAVLALPYSLKTYG